ncbi:FACT complex subunit [Rhizophlyctis rosea]|uniref:FACT complex subunit POB3 n=1 Tax=Rhizophlyctis rosea TaxID=64517 RepID=A0AAD5SLE4_9FUNG|nr:FACT complex subunit [Rhizophlyctis rosea]
MMGDARNRDFDNVFLTGKKGIEVSSTIPRGILVVETIPKLLQQGRGRLKLAEAGIGFKNADNGQVLTVPANDIHKVHWLRCARDWRFRIQRRNGEVVKIDGFPKDEHDTLASAVKSLYRLPLEQKEVSLRGWNWGTTDFSGPHMSFMVSNKPAFEIPLTEVANTTQPSKNEVSIELVGPGRAGEGDRRQKADTLTEIRFFVPGMATASQVGENAEGKKQLKDKEDALKTQEGNKEDGEIAVDDEELAVDDEGETISSASILFETIKQKADIDVLHSETIVSFNGLLCITPRGRFEIDFHATFLRLRGKSHDYKILYSSIQTLFLLPKPDELHHMLVIGLDPPVRQGQTRYPFLVFQFSNEDEVETNLNLDDETLTSKYEGKLQKSYDGPMYEVVTDVLKGLSGKKVTESKGTFRSAQAHDGIKCSLKAHEAFVFPLDKSILSIPKPTMHLLHADISAVTFSRVGATAGSNALKTFEIRIEMRNSPDIQFSSIARTEADPLQQYFRSKKIKIQSEMAEEGGPVSYAEGSDGEDDIPDTRGKASMDYEGGGDDSDESEDEDFVAESESDVAEEFNEDYQSESEAGGSDKESGSDADSSVSRKSKGSDDERPKSASKRKSSGGEKSDERPRKRAKKEKKEKDANAPKRFANSFMIFSNEKRAEVKASDPNMDIKDVSRKLGQMWKDMALEDKEKYEKLAQQDRARYDKEMAVYVPSAGGSSKAKASGSSKAKSSPAPAKSAKADKPSSSKKGGDFKSEEFINDSDEEMDD